MDIQKIEQILKDNNQPKFRLEQIQKAIYKDGVSTWAEITTIPKYLREILEKEMKVLSFEMEKALVAKDGQSIKALLKLSDGNRIETVLLSPRKDTWTACISSQVGCPLGCAFCATGKGGFKRNLTAEEITDQVLFWRNYLKTNFPEDKLKGIHFVDLWMCAQAEKMGFYNKIFSSAIQHLSWGNIDDSFHHNQKIFEKEFF